MLRHPAPWLGTRPWPGGSLGWSICDEAWSGARYDGAGRRPAPRCCSGSRWRASSRSAASRCRSPTTRRWTAAAALGCARLLGGSAPGRARRGGRGRRRDLAAAARRAGARRRAGAHRARPLHAPRAAPAGAAGRPWRSRSARPSSTWCGSGSPPRSCSFVGWFLVGGDLLDVQRPGRCAGSRRCRCSRSPSTIGPSDDRPDDVPGVVAAVGAGRVPGPLGADRRLPGAGGLARRLPGRRDRARWSASPCPAGSGGRCARRRAGRRRRWPSLLQRVVTP